MKFALAQMVGAIPGTVKLAGALAALIIVAFLFQRKRG